MPADVKLVEDFCVFDLSEDVFKNNKSEELKQKINEAIENNITKIYLNMRRVSHMNSNAINILLQIEKMSFYNDLQIRLFNMQPYVKQMLCQTRLNKIFKICEDAKNSADIVKSNILIA